VRGAILEPPASQGLRVGRCRAWAAAPREHTAAGARSSSENATWNSQPGAGPAPGNAASARS